MPLLLTNLIFVSENLGQPRWARLLRRLIGLVLTLALLLATGVVVYAATGAQARLERRHPTADCEQWPKVSYHLESSAAYKKTGGAGELTMRGRGVGTRRGRE